MNGRQNSIASSIGVGVVPRAVQNEFEKEEKKIHEFETTNKKFYKDLKYYLDKLDELIKNETKMINNISNLANTSLNELKSSPPAATTSPSSANQSFSSSNSSNNDLNNSLVNLNETNKEFLSKLTKWKELLNDHYKSIENFKQSNQTNVIDPMKNLNSIFPQVYQAIKGRESAYKELVKQQEKLEKLQDKERTGPNLVRINELNQVVKSLKQQFQNEHLFLMEELPKLYNSRVDLIKPCVNSLINNQAKFYSEYSSFYESVFKPTSTSQEAQPDERETDLEIESLNADVQKYLKDIKSLSIVASD